MTNNHENAPPPARPTILLVEDDAAVRRSLQLLLTAKGFDVRAYAVGASLLTDDSVAGAACLVADYKMAGLDGVALLEGLRGRGWHGPAILITAYASPELRAQALSTGFDEVIEKPLPQHRLGAAVWRAVEARRPVTAVPGD